MLEEKESHLDVLLEYLEQAANAQNLNDIYLSPSDQPLKTTIKIAAETLSKRDSVLEAESYYIGNQEYSFRSPGDQARNQKIEAFITTGKSIEGEAMLIVLATVLRTIKVSGGYEFTASMQHLRRHFRPAHRIFAECVSRSDAIAWNTWYGPMQQSVNLQKLNLRGVVLSQFDLCSANLAGSDLRNANLSGTNLSGANLDDCKLDGAVVDGADLFGAALPARYESLINASGLLERESVILL